MVTIDKELYNLIINYSSITQKRKFQKIDQLSIYNTLSITFRFNENGITFLPFHYERCHCAVAGI